MDSFTSKFVVMAISTAVIGGGYAYNHYAQFKPAVREAILNATNLSEERGEIDRVTVSYNALGFVPWSSTMMFENIGSYRHGDYACTQHQRYEGTRGGGVRPTGDIFGHCNFAPQP